MNDMGCPVALTHVPAYAGDSLKAQVTHLFRSLSLSVRSGDRALVKPNLIIRTGDGLACTNPTVVRAVCLYFLDMGLKVDVGDSPAFGSAAGVSAGCGLEDALRGLPVRIVELDRSRKLKLSFGKSIGISAVPFDYDLLVNVPKFKVHCQMRLSLAVKNYFGCVCGARKAFAHTRIGRDESNFSSMIIEVMQAMPGGVSIIDGISAMHVHGPRGGSPYPLGLLGASANPVALDTALYAMLGVSPVSVPLWKRAQELHLPGAKADDPFYTLEMPQSFDTKGFVIPGSLDGIEFTPGRLFIGAMKRIRAKIRGKK